MLFRDHEPPFKNAHGLQRRPNPVQLEVHGAALEEPGRVRELVIPDRARGTDQPVRDLGDLFAVPRAQGGFRRVELFAQPRGEPAYHGNQMRFAGKS